jgi:SAM-dependent methyltransferase
MTSGERAFQPVFWERLWREALVSSPVARRDRFGPAEKLAHWDRRAEGYARQSESAESRARRAELLRWLGSRGALQARFRVLDIGAGPGNFALPLATRVRQVTALEPAPGMAAILRRRQAARGLRNIRVVERGWGEVEVELEREAWAGAQWGPWGLARRERAGGPGAHEPGFAPLLLPERLVRRAVGAVGPGPARAVAHPFS